MLQGLFSAVSVKVVMLISISILIVVAIPATVAATVRPPEDAAAAASSRIVDPERRVQPERDMSEPLAEPASTREPALDVLEQVAEGRPSIGWWSERSGPADVHVGRLALDGEK